MFYFHSFTCSFAVFPAPFIKEAIFLPYTVCSVLLCHTLVDHRYLGSIQNRTCFTIWDPVMIPEETMRLYSKEGYYFQSFPLKNQCYQLRVLE